MERKRTISLVGQLGEELGCRYLRDKKYRILDRGYKNKVGRCVGELDIVAEYEGQIVFVEVKTRSYSSSGEILIPEENITQKKLVRLQKIARSYLQEKGWLGRAYRFDALSIIYDKSAKKAKIRHLEAIFL